MTIKFTFSKIKNLRLLKKVRVNLLVGLKNSVMSFFA